MHLSAIRLDSTVNMIVVAVLALLAVVAVPWFWDRWKRKQVGRSATTLLAVVLVIVSTAMAGNMIGGFFPSLGALLGTQVYNAEGTNVGDNGDDLDKFRDAGQMRAKEGKSSIVTLTVKGDRTGITRNVSVYFPPQYYDKAYHDLKFPVIEWIPNYPSGPEVAICCYHLPEQLDLAIAKHVLAPTVVIMPDPTGVPKVGHDTECVDEVNGAANDTFLTMDLRNWAIKKLGVSPNRRSWAIGGWSSGGYCAMNLVTRHPQWYGLAASVSGYDKASIDKETENLFQGRQDIADANNITMNLAKHPSPVEILAIAGDKENNESQSIAQMKKAVRPPTQLTSWVLADAGHNMNAFKTQIPDVLAWLGQRLAGTSTELTSRATLTGDVRPWPLPQTGAQGALVDMVE
ncbi:alpha/beta hydrolase [Amycolatopsis sp. H20-H5]|uniref:alpha/beta hydrolase n=1 Tax=Amycolatopsis sp. H20-H5 TaxID=3046309 RepID=UPI002DBE31BD|nr:alpha/beta hydrolase-fold protein [Amycolatopsis sp. H20-H5]MEC3978831.1 alpha/beta hydrolase-fold protein [Amycolatopsis sp. H20-H5]